MLPTPSWICGEGERKEDRGYGGKGEEEERLGTRRQEGVGYRKGEVQWRKGEGNCNFNLFGVGREEGEGKERAGRRRGGKEGTLSQ